MLEVVYLLRAGEDGGVKWMCVSVVVLAEMQRMVFHV